jgi:hypothetical protein
MKIFEEWLTESDNFLTKDKAMKLSSVLKKVFKKNKLEIIPHGEYQLKSKTRELNNEDYYIEFYFQGKEFKNARMNLVLLRMQVKNDKLDILINIYPYKEVFKEIDVLRTFEKEFPLIYKEYEITKQIHTGYDTILHYQAKLK